MDRLRGPARSKMVPESMFLNRLRLMVCQVKYAGNHVPARLHGIVLRIASCSSIHAAPESSEERRRQLGVSGTARSAELLPGRVWRWSRDPEVASNPPASLPRNTAPRPVSPRPHMLAELRRWAGTRGDVVGRERPARQWHARSQQLTSVPAVCQQPHLVSPRVARPCQRGFDHLPAATW